MSLSASVQESLWLPAFQDQLNIDGQTQPIKICCDNMSALDLAKSTGYSARTKHIDIRHHFIRQHIEEKTINLVHIPIEEMLTDVLTKPLFAKEHLFCTRVMGMLF